MSKPTTGKKQMMSGVFQFAWAELKTMNMTKIKGLYKIAVGYIKMRYFSPTPKRIESRQQQIPR